MKIYVLPVAEQFRPVRVPFRCPAHGADWDIERDMLHWLSDHPALATDDPDEADVDLFQPHWNKYYLQSWGQEGLEEQEGIASFYGA